MQSRHILDNLENIRHCMPQAALTAPFFTSIYTSHPWAPMDRLGVATPQMKSSSKLCGSSTPCKYFTFSWSLLIISVSLRPSTSSSWTHICTLFWNSARRWQLRAMILAMAPHSRSPRGLEMTSPRFRELPQNCNWETSPVSRAKNRHLATNYRNRVVTTWHWCVR